ncbi:hypothetical protein PRIPAC_81852 [Pristionchus pacificus]|uniref:Uncharacterized protein n=1 Tax=Pristionchus pacificus TaxID=54126 RepID=A0A2A6C1X9_PRIPA|nr:hypothetical protein PRIPAC_81852 [Pristionchus pacificus]|eukprot:PDM72174.1 hypothetical protein PRIPAC_38608 [Pristionchus pacificus]
MNYRTLTILAIVGFLFISSLDAAKPAKGKGKKGGEVKAEKVKNEKAADPALISISIDIAINIVLLSFEIFQGEAVVLEESAVIGEIPTPKIFRPKQMKMVTAYDKCKIECQKIRDQQDLHSYAAQLREELAAAEAILQAEAPLEEAEPAVAA